MSGHHLLEITDLHYAPSPERVLFDGAALAVHEDDRIGLWADNGMGKTSLLRILTGLLRPQSMKLLLDGEPIESEDDFKRVRRRFGYVLQNADDQLFFPEVIDDVMFGPLNLGMSSREAYAAAEETLRSLGILDLRHSETRSLSGGQKRLVSIASILAMHPTGLLLDEPTTGLDEKARERLIGILNGLPGPRLIVSHDREFLLAVSHRLVGIRSGHLVPFNFSEDGHFR